MKTGYRGTFVITWSQTEIDGLTGCGTGAISVGSTWRWSGKAVRVDDPRDILLLEGAEDIAEMHRRAAIHVRRIVGESHFSPQRVVDDTPEEPLFGSGFDITDGYHRYRATLVEPEGSHHPMLLFSGAMPPADQDLWVVSQQTRKPAVDGAEQTGGVVCFVSGTLIATADGPRPVDEILPGDRISTRDNGEQPVCWIGQRNMSGGRLVAMPHLRPVRLRSGFLGAGRPDPDLLVSPDHRILIMGAAAQTLFNTPEVLVTAADLINDLTVTIDHTQRDVTYVHLMFEQHQIVWANGVACDSFHPANAALEQIDTVQRMTLLEQFPTIADDPFGYGDFARRNLTRAEAAILSHDTVGGH